MSFPTIICRVRAIYSFHSEEPSSLNFDKGDYIDVLAQLASGWWDGWCDGARGWFPSNYVEIIDPAPTAADALSLDSAENLQSPTQLQFRGLPPVEDDKAARPFTLHAADLRSPPTSPTSTTTTSTTATSARHPHINNTNNNSNYNHASHHPQPRRKKDKKRRASRQARPYSSVSLATPTSNFGWTANSIMSRNSSGSSLDRKILPDGWSVQVAEDGVTCFYYNHRTGKMQYEHPMLSDTEYDSHDDEAALGASDDSYSDIDEDTFHDARETHYDSAMKPNRLSLDSLPANVDTPETVVSDASPHAAHQWVERVTPQGRLYYCNLATQETTWDYDDIDRATGRLKKPNQETDHEDPERSGQFPSSRDSTAFVDEYDPSIVASNAPSTSAIREDPLTWHKLAGDAASAIHRLNSAAQRGSRDTFTADASAVVVAIRVMLYASGSLDKDSGHMQDRVLRELHRAVMASLSKLVLSVKTASEGWAMASQPEALMKVQRDAGDLLSAVRGFVTTCQDKQITVEQVKPQLLIDTRRVSVVFDPVDYNSPVPPIATSMDAANKRTSIIEQGVVQKAKYPLNQDLVVSLQTHANQIYSSTDALSKASAFILSTTYDDDDDDDENHAEIDRDPAKTRSNVVILFRNMSMQIGQYLSILEDVDLASVDSSKIPSLAGFRINKQNLYNAVGVLFGAVQNLNNAHTDLEQAVTDIEDAINAIETTIGSILTSVEEMVEQRKLWYMQMTSGESETPLSPVMGNEVETDEESRQHQQQQRPAVGHQHRPSIAADGRKRPMMNRPAEDSENGLGHDYTPDEIVFGSDGNVKGGTLPALVERLTLHNSLDTSFIATFLLTYRSFCTTEEFLSLLEQRYTLRAPEWLTPYELETWTEKKQKLVRLRVFNVMKTWLENYYNAEDHVILGRLEFFTNTVIRDASPFSADQLNRLIRKRKELDANDGLKKLVPNALTGPLPIMPKDITRISLPDVDPLELARQLTLMDFKLYSSIRPIECLSKAWSQEGASGKVAYNVKQSIDYCNRLTCWVSDNILSYEEAKKRVVAIKYWAQVANRCRGLNNYNTCMAIISAFDNSAVGRLKKTWELVGNRTNQSLASIRKLMGANRNFTEYREMIHSVNPPCIPFLGIYLQDLTFIEDGNPDYIKKQTKLINFAKRQKAAEVIREINQFQSPPYTFHSITELQTFIQSHLESSRDVDVLYEKSLQLEPREAVAS